MLFQLMNGLDRLGELDKGCFVTQDEGSTAIIFAYGEHPGSSPGSELLRLSGTVQVDRFRRLVPEYLRKSKDRFVPGRAVHFSTEEARKLYQTMVEQKILEHLETVKQTEED